MKRKGKRGVAIGLAAALLCLCLPVFARGEELAVSARSAVLLSGESGAVLWAVSYTHLTLPTNSLV